MFKKDLEKLTADLEATDNKAAVVQQYEYALGAKSRVCCEFGQILVPPCSHGLQFVHELERLEKAKKAGREANLVTAHNRRIDQ